MFHKNFHFKSARMAVVGKKKNNKMLTHLFEP